MYEQLIEELERSFPSKSFLTVDEICTALDCDKQTIYNWSKRQNPKRRPPRIIVGKDVRFPRRPFVLWFAQEQGRVG